MKTAFNRTYVREQLAATAVLPVVSRQHFAARRRRRNSTAAHLHRLYSANTI